jgi:EAL and modified HD-GYP domain-containing signal transduction protein
VTITEPAPPSTGRGSFVLLGRIPIFDRHLEVLGYDFACASVPDHPEGTHSATSGNTSTDASEPYLDAAMAEPALIDDLAGSKRAWLTVRRQPSDEDIALAIPPQRCVLKVFPGGDSLSPAASGVAVGPGTVCRHPNESTTVDADIAEWGETLRRRGYSLAVNAWSNEASSLGDSASFTLIDPNLASENLGECLELLNNPARRTVMTGFESLQQVLEWARAGATLFHGHVLSKPTGEVADALSPSRLACLQLISRLRDPETTAKELSRILSGDVSLSYRTLHVSSLGAAGGLRRPVRSIEEAVVLLGRDRLYSWLTFMTLADMSPHANEQITIALVRARTCELFATSVEPSLADAAFTVGLISGIALIVGTPLGQLVAKMSVTDDIASAVLERRGALGAILCDAYEWEVSTTLPSLKCGIEPTAAGSHYLSALRWVSQIQRSIERSAA